MQLAVCAKHFSHHFKLYFSHDHFTTIFHHNKISCAKLFTTQVNLFFFTCALQLNLFFSYSKFNTLNITKTNEQNFKRNFPVLTSAHIKVLETDLSGSLPVSASHFLEAGQK